MESSLMYTPKTFFIEQKKNGVQQQAIVMLVFRFGKYLVPTYFCVKAECIGSEVRTTVACKPLAVMLKNHTNIMRNIFLLLLISFQQIGKCCYNEYRALLNGKIVYKEAINPDAAPRARFDSKHEKDFLRERIKELDSIYKLTHSIKDYSDLGTLLAYNGQLLKAKRIFQDIESKSPGLYQTAANLGTTYELLGQNDSALLWISKAIKINPDSHEGSEWIHLKILEAKIKAKGDSKYLWTYDILSLDFGDGKVPKAPPNIDLIKVCKDLSHQLEERMAFVKPKDPIVAQLLFNLGNAEAIIVDLKSALQIYKAASEYGYSSELFKTRRAYFTRLQSKADLKNNIQEFAQEHSSYLPIILISVIAVLLILTIILFRQIKKRRLRKISTNS